MRRRARGRSVLGRRALDPRLPAKRQPAEVLLHENRQVPAPPPGQGVRLGGFEVHGGSPVGKAVVLCQLQATPSTATATGTATAAASSSLTSGLCLTTVLTARRPGHRRTLRRQGHILLLQPHEFFDGQGF